MPAKCGAVTPKRSLEPARNGERFNSHLMRQSHRPPCTADISQRLFHRFGRWLEQFHQIAGWILQQDLAAARSGDDVVAKLDAGLSEDLYIAVKAAALHNYPIPSTRFRSSAIRHRLRTPTRAFWWAQH